MKILKMKKKFFDMIKNGEKSLEFRKLEKGYTSGVYLMVDEKDTTLKHGYVKLTPLKINPRIETVRILGIDKTCVMANGIPYTLNRDEIIFVKTNYIFKKIDFVAYLVEIVEEGDE